MLIGIDFDNTIACYDDGFLAVAKAMGLVSAEFKGAKRALRDHIRAVHGDYHWQRLQARLYGPDIGQATLMPGMDRLLERMADAGIPVVIVSHKTRTSPLDSSIDLREAALAWMETRGLFDRYGLSRGQVHFEPTRAEKIARIRDLGCTHFIDDLKEVFDDPEFPRSVHAYLYAPDDRADDGPFTWFKSHQDIADHLLGADPIPAATQLLGQKPVNVRSAQIGGNNRLYRLDGPDGPALLKCYPRPDHDPRARMATEWQALTFLAGCGEWAVPKPIASDQASGAALYEWIEGTRTETPDRAQLDQALAFCRRLHKMRLHDDANALPMASEACLSQRELVHQIRARCDRLTGVPEIAPLLARVGAALGAYGMGDPTELAPDHRTLSPSDFGFHNALVDEAGRVVFVDFEYFGWDDPVKLAADTFLHPGFRLSPALGRHFLGATLDIYGQNPDFRRRLIRDLPLYVLRWTMILLNEFLPDRLARRLAAGQTDVQAIHYRQLGKAETMLMKLRTVAKEVP